MGDDMERRVTVLETTLPFIQKELEAANRKMDGYHKSAVEAREDLRNDFRHTFEELSSELKTTNANLAQTNATIAARENQLLGGWFVGKKLLGLVAVVATAGSAAGTKIAAILAKVF